MRLLALIVVAAAALLIPAPASAVVPSATLTAATVTFTTNDDDKDGDTWVMLDITTANGRPAATRHDAYSHFDDGSVHGPYGLFVFSGVTAADFAPGALTIQDFPEGNDTWKFGYQIRLTFSDGTNYVFGETSKQLDDFASFTTKFTVVSQIKVPQLKGMTVGQAKTAITAAGLTVGDTTYQTSRCEEVGLVVGSVPGANTLVAAGAKVTIRVGTPPSTPCL